MHTSRITKKGYSALRSRSAEPAATTTKKGEKTSKIAISTPLEDYSPGVGARCPGPAALLSALALPMRAAPALPRPAPFARSLHRTCR